MCKYVFVYVSGLQSNKFILINTCIPRYILFFFEYPTHSLTSIKYGEFPFLSARFQAFLVPSGYCWELIPKSIIKFFNYLDMHECELGIQIK